MDWTHALTIASIVIPNMVMFFWVRTESRADNRALQEWTQNMITAIQAEMKDFHGRLCSIEERNRK